MLAAATIALVASVVVAAPFAAATWDVERAALPYVAASSVLELAYFFALAAAYTRSDLSLVYPVARGGAPVLVLLGAVALGRLPSAAEAAGVVVVAAGVLLVRGRVGSILPGAAIAALIAGYTIVDNAGIEHAGPIAYLELVLIPVSVAALIFVPGHRLRAAFGPAPVAAGIVSFAAYALVLAAPRTGPCGAGRRRPGDERRDRRGPCRRLPARARHPRPAGRRHRRSRRRCAPVGLKTRTGTCVQEPTRVLE